MPIAPRLGWLFLLAVVPAQEPAGASGGGGGHLVALQASVATPANARAPMDAAASIPGGGSAMPPAGTDGQQVPPAPVDGRFAVPEAQTLLIVGTALVLFALAKRRVRVGPVVVR